MQCNGGPTHIMVKTPQSQQLFCWGTLRRGKSRAHEEVSSTCRHGQGKSLGNGREGGLASSIQGAHEDVSSTCNKVREENRASACKQGQGKCLANGREAGKKQIRP